MPTYSYRCEACDKEFEKEQRISEDPIRKCPFCGKLKARRMISSGNFILKGGGWYSDGYGSGSGSKSSRSSKDDSGSSSSSSSSSSGSKDDGGKSSSDKSSPAKDDKGSPKAAAS
jgi:putative FmdB family regulatory protein